MTALPPPEATAQAETVVLRLRRHGRALTLPVVVLIAVAAAAGFWVGALPEAWMNISAAAAAGLIALVLGIGPVLGWLASRTVVTSRRVILRRGLFVQHRSEVPLGRVREVRAKRNLLQRLFGSGDIELLCGVDGSTVLRDVPGSELVADALQELMERNFAQAQAQASSIGQFGVPGQFGQLARPAQAPQAAFPPQSSVSPQSDAFGADATIALPR